MYLAHHVLEIIHIIVIAISTAALTYAADTADVICELMTTMIFAH